ncbi:hypothetical protein P6U16_25880 (plasmid) [Rhizobium sp. 32-5/1]|uniref:hypothetical protein n=1 Tax=Rhizobium sp. 32-5/1 TaxID=3019602 RepID=UPI00240DDF24|nr:hypothetical protein [Rhizobium sp. 32-5/1]WEZ85500.1 hypothetical protein P6U16_25880 [Rhizobium sp. 32-5/1]
MKEHLELNKFNNIKSFNRPGCKPNFTKIEYFNSFVRHLLNYIESLREICKRYFDDRRRENFSWVNNSQNIPSLLGAAAILLTVRASGLRLNEGTVFGLPGADKALLVATLLLYGLMAALPFFEKGTDRRPMTNDFAGASLLLRWHGIARDCGGSPK